MKSLIRHTTFRRSVALLLAVTLSAGCVSWQPAVGREGYVITQQPKHVRVAIAGAERVHLYAPVVVGNQLVGYRQAGVEASRTAIPMRDVTSIEVLREDGLRTTLLVGTVSALAAFTAIGLAEFQSHKLGGGFSLR